MAQVDLIFSRPPLPGGPVHLVFGDDEVTVYEATLSAILPSLSFSAAASPPNDATLIAALPSITLSALVVPPNNATLVAALPALTLEATFGVLTGVVYEATLVAALPGVTLTARGAPPNDATVVVGLPGLTLAASGRYDLNVSRPTVGQVSSRSQAAAKLQAGVEHTQQAPVHTIGVVVDRSSQAEHLNVGVEARKPGTLQAMPTAVGARSQDASGVRSQVESLHTEMLRDRRPSVRTGSQDATPVRSRVQTDSQDRQRDRRPSVRTGSQAASPLRRGVWTDHQKATRLQLQRRSRSQDARKPPPGLFIPPIPPGPTPCYTPSPDLVFWDRTQGPHLLFICDNHVTPEPPIGNVVVPIQKVYIVLNDVYLKRVVGNIMLPATSLSLSIDADSWTWAFSASLPLSAEDDVMPVAGEPVELEASINGSVYRLLAENISRERAFGSKSVKVSGRGKSALLASPYSPVQSFTNSGARTAQQLMADVLTLNGVSLGWDVDWQLADWLVPAGAFNVSGSNIDALNSIVGAAGGYLQAHQSLQTIHAMPRYPVAPWAWNTVTPDFTIPSAVATREGIEWKNKAEYNRVFVSGQGQGVLGRVTRAGTAGDVLAPMVTDPLITHIDAARQRGLSILGDTGRIANVTLSLPVLPATGVIRPGKFVQYTDGGVTRLGLTRAVSVSTGKQVRQSILLETHE